MSYLLIRRCAFMSSYCTDTTLTQYLVILLTGRKVDSQVYVNSDQIVDQHAVGDQLRIRKAFQVKGYPCWDMIVLASTVCYVH